MSVCIHTCDFINTCTITDQIRLHSVLLPLSSVHVLAPVQQPYIRQNHILEKIRTTMTGRASTWFLGDSTVRSTTLTSVLLVSSVRSTTSVEPRVVKGNLSKSITSGLLTWPLLTTGKLLDDISTLCWSLVGTLSISGAIMFDSSCSGGCSGLGFSSRLSGFLYSVSSCDSWEVCPELLEFSSEPEAGSEGKRNCTPLGSWSWNRHSVHNVLATVGLTDRAQEHSTNCRGKKKLLTSILPARRVADIFPARRGCYAEKCHSQRKM